MIFTILLLFFIRAPVYAVTYTNVNKVLVLSSDTNSSGNSVTKLTIDGVIHTSEFNITVVHENSVYKYYITRIDGQNLAAGAYYVEYKLVNIVQFPIEFNVSGVDTVPPGVTSVIPANGRTDVALNESIQVTFSENVINADGNHISISPEVSGSYSYSNNKVTFNHVTNTFSYDTLYTVTLSGISDSSGNIMSDYSYSFRTVKDTSPLQVLNIIPPPGASDVNVDTNVKIQFSKNNLDTSTFSLITVSSNDVNVPVNKTYVNDTITINFVQPLEYSKFYILHIEGVKDLIGNGMLSPIDCSFTTMSDNTPLKVTSYKPPTGQFISLSDKIIIDFNKNINSNTVDYSLFDDKGVEYNCSKSVVGNQLILTPLSLKAGEGYKFTLNTVSDMDGNALSNPLIINFSTINATGNNYIDDIVSKNFAIFSGLKDKGLLIIIAALVVGVLFFGARWLWKKLKYWIMKMDYKHGNYQSAEEWEQRWSK